MVVTRFLQEAKSVNMINHENIINIYDYGYAPDKSVYFVMEYLDGEELSKFHKRLGKVPMELLFPVYLQMMKALAAAHEKEIIHRDLKPANIFLQRRDGNPYFVKVLDFGVAALRGDGKIEGLTRAGSLLGTPQFMSPEQVGGEAVDARSDIFSLGIMLYRAATGKLPFQGQGFAALAQQICLEEPAKPRDVAPELSEELERIILKSLVKEKDQRYQSLRDMLKDFDALRIKLGIPEHPPIHSEEEALAVAAAAAMTSENSPKTGSDGSTSAAAFQGNTQQGLASPIDKTNQPSLTTAAPSPKSKTGLIIGIAAALGLAGGAAVMLRPAPPVDKNTVVVEDKAPPPIIVAPKTLPEEAEERLRKTITDGETPQSKIDAAIAASAVASGRAAKLLGVVFFALEKGSPQASKETYQPLANLKLPESLEKLKTQLGAVNASRATEIAAVLLSSGDTSGIKILEKALTGADPVAKFIAAVALAKNKSADPAIKTFLSNQLGANAPGKAPWLRAAEGLIALGDTATKTLLETELTSNEPLRMIAAAEVLARGGDTPAQDSLVRWVQQVDFTQRAAASLALSRLGDAGAFAIVEEGIKDVDAETRFAAVVAIGRFSEKGAAYKATIEKLFKEDPSQKVQLAAAAAILALP